MTRDCMGCEIREESQPEGRGTGGKEPKPGKGGQRSVRTEEEIQCQIQGIQEAQAMVAIGFDCGHRLLVGKVGHILDSRIRRPHTGMCAESTAGCRPERLRPQLAAYLSFPSL